MKYLIITIIIFFQTIPLTFAQSNNRTECQRKYNFFTSKNIALSDIDKYIIAYKDSLSQAKQNNNNLSIACYNLILAKLYSNLGVYNNSIEHSKVALKIFEQLKDTNFLINTYINMGITYGAVTENNIALSYFKKIDSLATLLQNERVKFHNYVNLGAMTLDSNPKIALEYFEKAKEYFINNNSDNITITGILNNIALAHKRLKEYSKAINILKNTLKTIDKKHVYYSTITSNIAATYLLQNKLDSAIHYTYLALKNPTNMQYLNNYVNYYRILTDSYIKKNIPDSATKYFNLFTQAKDSIALKNEAEYKSKLNVIYETDKLLSNIEKQKRAIEKYHTRIINMTIGIIILSFAVLIFFILYKKLQTSYKNIVKESVQSVKIEEENIALQNKIDILEKNTDYNEKNKNINLKIENSDELFEQAVKLLKTEKLYTNKDFNLNMLAERLNTNRTYISNIINSKTGDSFVKFINSYRVKEAKRLLVDDKNKILTLDAIGKAAGFSSTSTFNRVFKAETGVTPSFFAKNKGA